MEQYFVNKSTHKLRALKLYYISHALKITLRKDISIVDIANERKAVLQWAINFLHCSDVTRNEPFF